MIYKFFYIFLLLDLLSACSARRQSLTDLEQVKDILDHIVIPDPTSKKVKLPEREYDQELFVFVDQFVRDAANHGHDIDPENIDKIRVIKYVDRLTSGNSPGVMAACNRFYAAEREWGAKKKVHWMTIEVLRNESYEYTSSSECPEVIMLRELLYHELFHCLFRKSHLPSHVPGIMNAIFNKGDNRSCRQWPQLLKEMFSPEYMDLMESVR